VERVIRSGERPRGQNREGVGGPGRTESQQKISGKNQTEEGVKAIYFRDAPGAWGKGDTQLNFGGDILSNRAGHHGT